MNTWPYLYFDICYISISQDQYQHTRELHNQSFHDSGAVPQNEWRAILALNVETLQSLDQQ